MASSITPGEPTPTPTSAAGSTPAAWQAAVIASTISAATSEGPPVDGVGCREDPSTVFSLSTTIASILVPPRSIPPRSAERAVDRREVVLRGVLAASIRRDLLRRSAVAQV